MDADVNNDAICKIQICILLKIKCNVMSVETANSSREWLDTFMYLICGIYTEVD